MRDKSYLARAVQGFDYNGAFGMKGIIMTKQS